MFVTAAWPSAQTPVTVGLDETHGFSDSGLSPNIFVCLCVLSAVYLQELKPLFSADTLQLQDQQSQLCSASTRRARNSFQSSGSLQSQVERQMSPDRH